MLRRLLPLLLLLLAAPSASARSAAAPGPAGGALNATRSLPHPPPPRSALSSLSSHTRTCQLPQLTDLLLSPATSAALSKIAAVLRTHPAARSIHATASKHPPRVLLAALVALSRLQARVPPAVPPSWPRRAPEPPPPELKGDILTFLVRSARKAAASLATRAPN
jgi:hypothetical protein